MGIKDKATGIPPWTAEEKFLPDFSISIASAIQANAGLRKPLATFKNEGTMENPFGFVPRAKYHRIRFFCSSRPVLKMTELGIQMALGGRKH